MTTQAPTDQVIEAIHALSTGSGEMHREHRYGTWLPQMWWVLTSRSWIKAPIHFFALQHRHGLVLFDTGLDPRIATDPEYIKSAIGRFLLRRIFRLHITANDTLDQKLNAVGLAASDVCKAVISHLHFDHVGGIAHIPQAKLIVSANEWNILAGPHPEREWILREHIELPQAKWQPIEFAPTDDPLFAPFGSCHDVMGDGSMLLLPTPGHTPGSMSMLVRNAGWRPILLVGDLTYAKDLLMKDQVPGTGNAKELRRTYAKVRDLISALPDLVILPAHDPETANALEAATRTTSG